MAKYKREWVERGLYRTGPAYEACASPRGGRPQWRWLGEVGIQRARELRDQHAVAVRSGGVLRAGERSTFAEVAEAVLLEVDALVAAGELKPRSRESYRTGIVKHAIPTFGARQIQSITPDDVAAWVARQQRSGAAEWTVRARWTALRLVFSHAARHGLISASPADVLRRRERPRHGRSRQRFLSRAETGSLLDCAGAGVGDLYTERRLCEHYADTMKAGISLMVFCGLRVSEALGLAPEEVNFDSGHIEVRYQLGRDGRRAPIKTDQHSNAGQRDVVMMAALGTMLRNLRMLAPPGAETVLVTPYGRPVQYRRFLGPFAAARLAAGLDGTVTPHALRHTFASILIDQGRSVEYVAQQLGHSNTTTTWDTYVHLFRAREQADAARKGLDEGYGRMLGGA